MKTSGFHALALLLVASIGHAADTAPAALMKKLRSMSGAGAQDCGSVAQGGDRGAVIACARAATASGRAYRVAVQLEGEDSSTWQGAVRDEHGKLWVVFYDSDPSGSSGPTVSSLLCREILFAVKGSDAMECQPIFGEP
jgi:hypothetical protein